MNKIRALCDRYFNGETSAEEEQRLRKYLRLAEDVPADLRAVKVMLCGMDDAASMTYRPSGTGQHTTRGSVRKMSIRRVIWGTIAAIEGYSNKELADILETDETNVRTILSRGRKALREIIEKEIGYGI